MTVSIKRLIAYVALIAVALAGTPTRALATDGLKTERYGLKDKTKKIEVARQVPANLNQNPFRNKTVTATLRGASIQLDRSSVAESSLAIILMHDRIDPGQVATVDRKINEEQRIVETLCQIHPPLLNSRQIGFYPFLYKAGQFATVTAVDMFDVAMQRAEIAAIAECEFSKTVTAASVGYTRPHVIEIQPGPLVRSSAVIRNIQTAPIVREIASRPMQLLNRKSGGNISIVVLDNSVSGVNSKDDLILLGQALLIDDYESSGIAALPAEDRVKPRALAVPAISISHRREIPEATFSAGALIQSTKAIVISIINAIEPIIGLRQARILPEKIQDLLYQIDELIWSSSNLKHVWNVVAHHK